MKNLTLYKTALQKIKPAVEVDNKSFLITGASGLIGSCLIDLLMTANKVFHNHVYALGRSKAKLQNRFNDYLESSFFHILEQDIRTPLSDELHFDYIIHGASNADPISYAKYPAETMLTNMEGGINILEYTRKHFDCKAEILSTFEVYGKLDKDDYVEQDAGTIDFNQIRSCYPESKRVMEILSRCYVDEYNANVNIGRLCSIYGPTMATADSKAHAQFMRNALEGKDIVLKSTGEQKRTYCYVLDAVTGILTVLFHGKKGEAYNISNEQSVVTIAELAQVIAGIAGRSVIFDLPSELEKKGFSKPQNCVLDNSKLRALGWSGNYDINQGIGECLSILGFSKKIDYE